MSELDTPLAACGGFVHDKKLLALIILVTILSLGHTADHIARGDLSWPLSVASLPSVIITLAIYAVLGFGLYFYLTNKVGPGFWAIAAGIGVLFGWLAHFSPFTDQTPQYICSAYKTPAIGWLALIWLVALMISLIVAGLYAEYLWARQPQRR
jgi:hypothetical protein